MLSHLSIKDILYALIVSAIYVLIFSTTTSPLYYKPLSVDSAAFQLIGKYWSEGYLPYVDLWDLKGPIIFWINAVGYWMTGSAFGVLILQVLFMTVFGLIAYKMLRESFNQKFAKGLLIVLMFGSTILYSDGNTVEEYAVPFLMVCFYGIFKWSKLVSRGSEVALHKPGWAFLYGVTFAFCLLTRVTDAIGICIGILIILVYLMYYRAWENIMRNAIAFILGVLLLIVPFVGFFAYKGALYDLWYGTIFYSIKYYENSSFNYFYLPWKSMIYMLMVWMGYALLLAVGFIKAFFLKEQKIAGILWLSVSLGSLLWIFTSNGFIHYSIIAIPYICIAMCEYDEIRKNLSVPVRKAMNVMAVFVILGFVVQTLYLLPKNVRLLLKIEVNDNIMAYEEILENIPREERNVLVGYNIIPEFYLYNDLRPCYKFFSYQDFQADRNPEFRELLREPFLTCTAKWIVVDNNAVAIYDILQQNYELIYRSKLKPWILLYKLKSDSERGLYRINA